MKKIQITALFLFLGLTFSVFADTPEPVLPIKAFHQVTNSIYRGARPNLVGMNALLQLGIKTVLDLENNEKAINEESKMAEILGMHFISMPMSGFWAPDDIEVNRILSIISDPTNYPIYVHCLHGQDRTGVIMGLYRVFSEKWTYNDAYAEMIRIGFHPDLFLLKMYFDNKTSREL